MFYVIVFFIVILFFYLRSGGLNNTIKIKIKSYEKLREAFPDLSKKEIYKKCLDADPMFDGWDPYKRHLLDESTNFRSLVEFMLSERFIYKGNPMGLMNIRDKKEYLTKSKLLNTIHRKINELIPEEY